MICKNWRVHCWPATWELTLGFDRLKTTPDRSALGVGCTTTLKKRGSHKTAAIKNVVIHHTLLFYNTYITKSR